jgi:hypothetical protein
MKRASLKRVSKRKKGGSHPLHF